MIQNLTNQLYNLDCEEAKLYVQSQTEKNEEIYLTNAKDVLEQQLEVLQELNLEILKKTYDVTCQLQYIEEQRQISLSKGHE